MYGCRMNLQSLRRKRHIQLHRYYSKTWMGEKKIILESIALVHRASELRTVVTQTDISSLMFDVTNRKHMEKYSAETGS